MTSPQAALPDPLQVLCETFGFPAFRGEQEAVIAQVMSGSDALVLMPTGGGKSLCYQIPALCLPGTAVVVSPLIALMQDQVEALTQLGIAAAALNSTLSSQESSALRRRLLVGDLDLLYVSPERLLMSGTLELLARCRLSLFAIDEAHCVSQWGHDFRPEYRQLALLAERFPGVPRLALTATADAPTRRDILERLKLEGGTVFVAGFDRPNIRYRVVPKRSPRDQLLAFLRQRPEGEAGIVYCMSRAKVEQTASWLEAQGYTALPYHAGLDSERRALHQDRFLKEEGVIMVATIAFGMGIDKPNVRFVAHLDLPKSLEAYYQETGRAGRDGLSAEAWMAYGMEDIARLRQLVEASAMAEAQKRVERQKLDALLGYCESIRCRRQILLSVFGESLPEPCGNCDTCLEPVAAFDGTEAAQLALSCVYRTGQRFGAGHVIDVLMGAQTERVRRLGHDKLKLYGLGRERGRESWRSILRQLVAQGLLLVDIEGHGGLRLGKDCRPVLRGEQRVSLREETLGTRLAQSTRRKREAPQRPSDGPEARLFESLRDRRLALARDQGVPPYVIFHDTTLLEMARLRPRNLTEMANISGVGKSKLERYGEEFLTIIAEAAEEAV